MPRFLVITRAGNNEFHERWIRAPGPRNFDLLVSYYNDAFRNYKEPGVHTERRPGTKVAGLSRLLQDKRSFVASYDHVLIVDDDIATTTADLNRLFEIAARHSFLICQPSLTHNSYFSYAALLQNTSYSYRSVTFIEMMCPCFRTDLLDAVANIYALGHESGIDLLWCNLRGDAPGSYAVIDEVAVTHTRPVGGRKHENGFLADARYEDDIARIMRDFQVPWLPCVVYHAATRAGARVTGRIPLTLSALKLVLSVPRKAGLPARLRAVATHWKHLLFSAPRNLRLREFDPS